MKRNLLPLLMIPAMAISSCTRTTEKTVVETDTVVKYDTVHVNSADNDRQREITLMPVAGSPEYPGAKLTLNAPVMGAAFKSGDSVLFNYTVSNFYLGSQTADAPTKQCNNSEKGQHIHLILNNAPYEAWYIPKFKKKLDEEHYVALSFLSRSYHESVKTKDAYVLRQFGNKAKNIDLKAPHLFYSRPKGEYKGKDTEKILLDFYLVNTTLAKGGNKVCATINGKEFILDSWQPYLIEGLPMGENTIKLELLDSKGGKIAGPFNSVTRTITLSPDPAL